MGKTLAEIAQHLKDVDKKVQLIYAFNGMGKTRLSKEFKLLIASNGDGEVGGGDSGGEDRSMLSWAKVLYYNAFTEDLFYWDNDLINDLEPKLKVQANSFTIWLMELLKEQGQDGNIAWYFQRYANDRLTPYFSDDFSEISFSLERGDDGSMQNLKISKGEESNFIWSVFYSLLDQAISTLNIVEPGDRETDKFDHLEYIFIDDPVSSLDENHLIEVAVELARQIKSSPQGLKFIVSTHSPLFYNVLYSELNNRNGYLLDRLSDGTFSLMDKGGSSNLSFSYHLHLKRIIEDAVINNKVEKFHFTLLRNLYEKTASFLGYANWQDLLDTMAGDKQGYASRIMHFSSHRTLSNEEMAEPTPPEKEMVGLLLRNLNEYGYWQQELESG